MGWARMENDHGINVGGEERYGEESGDREGNGGTLRVDGGEGNKPESTRG